MVCVAKTPLTAAAQKHSAHQLNQNELPLLPVLLALLLLEVSEAEQQWMEVSAASSAASQQRGPGLFANLTHPIHAMSVHPSPESRRTSSMKLRIS